MLRLYLTHLKGYGRPALLAPVMMILEVICELLLPLVMTQVVDFALPASDAGQIVRLGGIMLILAGASMLFGVLGAKFATDASQGFGANLRQGLFEKVMTFSFGDIDRFSSASLITRMTNDVNAMTMMLSMGLRMLVRAPVMLIAAVAISAMLNLQLSLVPIVMLPVAVIIIAIVMKVCTRLFVVMQKRLDSLNNTLQENLVAVRVVKAFVRKDYEQRKFQQTSEDLMNAGLNVGLRIVALMPVMMMTLNLATVAVLYFGGKMVMGGTFEVGQLQAFLSYIFQVLMSVMMLAMTLLQMSRAQACARRIHEVLDTRPDISDREQPSSLPRPQGQVEFRDVTFRYNADGSGDDVLSHVSLKVEPGQLAAIVGGTGTGKSSLVNLIPRFYDVNGGAVLLDGVDVRDYPLEELRNRIGMVLQTNLLFSGTVRDNLLWGSEQADEADLIQALKDAQAYDFVMDMPDGLDTRLDQGGVNLSGGQKQRLCIARAMLRKPAVLILDDSTSAVDSATEAAIRDSFHRNLSGTTVILIAQRISSVQSADRIFILEDDHIAGCGTHEELLKTNPIYQEIYQSQQEGVGQ